jgi:hypothetical protein
MIEGTEKDLHFPSYFSKVNIFSEGHKGFKETPKFFLKIGVQGNNYSMSKKRWCCKKCQA